MKVKMTEHYQDARTSLAPGNEYDVDAALGAWLVAHRKAIKLEVVAAAPMPRHLDVEPQFEQAEEPPKPEPKRKRSKQ